ALLAVLATLSGCVDERPTPVGPPAPQLDPTPTYARSPRESGRQLVVLKEGRSANLRQLVTQHGGTLVREYPQIGVAVARGLSASAVSQLERNAAVEGVDPDLRVQWVPPRQQTVR